MLRYGMRFNTIRYFMESARTHKLYNGYLPNVFTAFFRLDIARYPARDIGHYAIEACAYHGPETFKRILTAEVF